MTDEDNRKKLQNSFIRICRDSGYKMDYLDAAIFVADIIKCSPLEIWLAFGGFDQMKQIARGEHPLCKNI